MIVDRGPCGKEEGKRQKEEGRRGSLTGGWGVKNMCFCETNPIYLEGKTWGNRLWWNRIQDRIMKITIGFVWDAFDGFVRFTYTLVAQVLAQPKGCGYGGDLSRGDACSISECVGDVKSWGEWPVRVRTIFPLYLL